MTGHITNPGLFSVTNDDVEKPITGLEDVRLVPTPVTYSCWGANGREDRIEDELRATLFADVTPHDFTMIASNVYGDPFLKVGRLQGAVIKPRPSGGWSPWSLRISFVPPKKKCRWLRARFSERCRRAHAGPSRHFVGRPPNAHHLDAMALCKLRFDMA